jgi:predicted transcriptional regulator
VITTKTQRHQDEKVVGRGPTSVLRVGHLPRRESENPGGKGAAPSACLTWASPAFTLKNMEIHLSPDREARLRQFATRTGRDAAQVVEEAVDQMLEYQERFLAAVEQGRASARRGDLLEHDEVVERIEQMFRS